MDEALQCSNLSADRAIGGAWEKRFCALAANFNRSFTAHQIKRVGSAQAISRKDGRYHPMTLPDITVWTFPGEHHEIKHKDATGSGCFGLEKYRLDALRWFRLETKQRVFYTIHDYGKQPDETREKRKNNEKNDPSHWVTCEVDELEKNIEDTLPGTSWVRSQPKEVEIHYWRTRCFRPLLDVWQTQQPATRFSINDAMKNATADVTQGFGIEVDI